ncbi:DUF2490 domain-containing protein [Dyadobacter fanqingshengii]|uniref:DUF2490 domain-containing protein n=1 Tax=Dyadobacter fanqingshengii TaxID=2906443 RepID=A0A9X1PAN8_9BACT|nr:DUF2490 domain-containing protein [Dyadobacter fanqingshengii]MCF0040438.1 DUF2490 domain-containing protein [Dyadobacter fanqingshengii]USJ37820.1 DUF2490 domain-containing protein [Dyadobacter fanqingshengii]
MYKSFLACLLYIIIPVTALSQANYRAGTLSQINVNVKVAETWKLNTKLETRQIFSSKKPEALASHRFDYERTDLNFILTKKVSADNTVGGGYLIRLEDGRFTHRFIQQFNHVKNLEVLSVAHRIVADETFSADNSPEFRLRYRLGLEMPLNGQQIDPKEFYGKINNEYLGIFSNSDPDLEIRGLAAIGYNASDNNKIELGLEYRVNEFNTQTKAQQFWLTIAWFVSI